MDALRTFDGIDVKLVGSIPRPYETAVASARTCYCNHGIVLPEDVSSDEKSILLRDSIARSTLEAGHVTTRQHAHFVFAISGVSRHFLWNFLHGHPFYNSEQVSQRYVRIKRGNYLMPPLMSPRAEKIFSDTVNEQMESYERLIEVLRKPLSKEFFERFPARAKQPDKWAAAIDKRTYEIARYVIGIGATSYLYHTVNALTLLRYKRLVNHFETPREQKIVIDKMCDEVKKADPLFASELPEELPNTDLPGKLPDVMPRVMPNVVNNTPDRFIDEFDKVLGGRVSKLVSFTPHADKLVAAALRTSLGVTSDVLSDERAVALLMDPKENPILSDAMNLATFDRFSQALHHVQFTYYKKLSHTADSQDERHRMVMSSRPVLVRHYRGTPDYITPFAMTQTGEAYEIFTKSMLTTFNAVNELIDLKVPTEFAFYLLPNAFTIRLVSSGDLQAFQHKWKLRLCYNAQEEIFRASLDELTELGALFPTLAAHLGAPCSSRFRANSRPFCPEGERFCGLAVWKLALSDYRRNSL